MPLIVSHNLSSNIVEIEYVGFVSKEDLMYALVRYGEFFNDFGSRKILANCIAMTGGHGVEDLEEKFSQYTEYKMHEGAVEAIVVPQDPSLRHLIDFAELSALNAGIIVKLFADRDSAVKWLMETPVV